MDGKPTPRAQQAFVKKSLLAGQAPDVVVSGLVARGMDREAAARLVDRVQRHAGTGPPSLALGIVLAALGGALLLVGAWVYWCTVQDPELAAHPKVVKTYVRLVGVAALLGVGLVAGGVAKLRIALRARPTGEPGVLARA